MNKLTVTPAQFDKLIEMCRSFFPKYEYESMNYQGLLKYNENLNIHWFELCITHITDKVAQEFAKQPFGTHSYARFYILQTLFSQLIITHPVDFLYDMWKNPANYAQNL